VGSILLRRIECIEVLEENTAQPTPCFNLNFPPSKRMSDPLSAAVATEELRDLEEVRLAVMPQSSLVGMRCMAPCALAARFLCTTSWSIRRRRPRAGGPVAARGLREWHCERTARKPLGCLRASHARWSAG